MILFKRYNLINDYKKNKMKMDLENLQSKLRNWNRKMKVEWCCSFFGLPCGIDVAHIFQCEPKPPITAKHTCAPHVHSQLNMFSQRSNVHVFFFSKKTIFYVYIFFYPRNTDYVSYNFRFYIII